MATQFPLKPSKSIDWDNIGFKTREVNGHVECRYSTSSGTWTEPEFVTDPYMRIHGMAPGLNYGQQCFEGLKAFRMPDGQISIFRPSMNADRMQRSASFVSIPVVPQDLFLRACHFAVAMNTEYVPPHETGAALYIRPLLFGSSAQLPLNPPDGYTFAVYVLPVGVYHGADPVDALILENFDRSAPNGTGSAKIGGNYAPVLRWSESARKDGYGITLHLDSLTRSEIDEFSTSAFLGVKIGGDGQPVLVAPKSENVITSVTAESVCDIARMLGWTVEKRRIAYDELPGLSEVIAAGTAAALVPIRSITMKSKGDKFQYIKETVKPGPAFTNLLKTLKDIQLGKLDDTYGWRDLVMQPSAEMMRKIQDFQNGGPENDVVQLP